MNAPAPAKPAPATCAEEAGLIYVSDAMPGIRRIAARGGFRYLDPAGRPVREEATLERIRALVIPPAWREVWISPLPEGHLQAVGRDARNRKQYRYHPRWHAVRDATKYGQLAAFGRALPAIRARVERDLALPGLPRAKLLATLVRLLESTLMRIGNAEYARQNESFGLTTLREHHVAIEGPRVFFRFRGKSGVEHRVALRDARLARILRRAADLPGEELFQYIDEDGTQRSIESHDVNRYLREITGCDFSAKDFRTWSGSVLAARALREFPAPKSRSEAKRTLATAVAAVAGLLGNTRSVCRKAYVHPDVIAAYEDGSLCGILAAASDGPAGLSADEAALLALLDARTAVARAMPNASRPRRRARAGVPKGMPQV